MRSGWALIVGTWFGLAVAGAALWARDAGESEGGLRWRARALAAESELEALRARLAPPDPARRGEAGAGAAVAPPLPAAWRNLAESALQQQAQRRLGRDLEPAALDELLERLAALHEAAAALEADEAAGGSVSLRGQMRRSARLLQAERALRRELGIGLRELQTTLEADPPGASGGGA